MDDGNCTVDTCGFDSPHSGQPACNYNPQATDDDGSCLWEDCGGGCTCRHPDHPFTCDVQDDCNGVCGGEAVEDVCDECNGDGPDFLCPDNITTVCNDDDCNFNPEDCPNNTVGKANYLGLKNRCVPTVFSFVNQSSKIAFYYISSVTINGEPIDTADWVGAFNGDVCVGARKWAQCVEGYCDVPLMGVDTNIPNKTAGYMQTGDIPTFQIYDASAVYYDDANVSENIPWEAGEEVSISSLALGPLSIYDRTMPDTYSIYNIYPNPFNPITIIEYSLPENASIELFVYNIHGRHIQTLVQSFQTAGYHSINWNAQNYPSGVYLIRLESSTYSQMQKVVLFK